MTSFWRGAFWMVLAALSFAVLLLSVRGLSEKFPTIEIVFVRATARTQQVTGLPEAVFDARVSAVD